MIYSIFGPTGSGKTEVAVHIANLLGTSVVNCDPSQCYSGLNILTNKPTAEHDLVAAHRMVAIWPVDHEASVATFADAAHREIDELIAMNGVAVTCSGSGLYLRAALTSLEFGASTTREQRSRFEYLYDVDAGVTLYESIRVKDPDAAERISPNDRKRVIRAAESITQGESVKPNGRSLWDAPYRRSTVSFALRADRSVLRDRIDARTSQMFLAGVLDEVDELLDSDPDNFKMLSSTMQRIHGLDDCVAVLAQTISVDEAMQRISTKTKQYIKRQDTWARRWPGIRFIDVAYDPFVPELIAERLLEDTT